MKKATLITGAVITGLVLAAGTTHLWIPAASDPCQQDLSHQGHVASLPLFHCIGHTEFEVLPGAHGLAAVGAWDHLHPWMDRDWHLEQGFTPDQADRLLAMAGE